MNQTTAVVLIVIGGLNLVATGTLAFALLRVGKKVDTEMNDTKVKANASIQHVARALQGVEF